MKALRYALFLLCTSTLALPTSLYLKPTKTGGWSLRSDFLAYIADLFHNDVFIESGTSYGVTVQRAKEIFKQVHSIELDESLFIKACNNFVQDAHVYLYHGDSSTILPSVLATCKNKKIVCWLDGHYSGGTTAKGEVNTPILKELKAIEQAGCSNAVILIDDVCCFRPAMPDTPDTAVGYPSIAELKKALERINPQYRFVIYADIAIAFPPEYQIEISPLIAAMTQSRMFDQSLMSYEDVFKAEGIIASKTSPDELEALWDNCTYHFGWHRAHAYLWYALSLFTAERYGEAYDNLLQVLECGYTNWRVAWYAMQAAHRSGKDYSRFTSSLFARSKKELEATACFLQCIK